MKKQLKQRLTRLVETFGTVPVPPSIVEAAFDEFRRTGELPEDARVAHAVTQRAKTGFPTVYRPDGTMDWGATMQAAFDSPKREADPILDELYLEAVFGPELVQWAARQVLRALAAVGEDVSRPQFLDWQPELSEFGTVGLSLLGFPQRLAKAPHATRANDLFARMQQLAEQVGRRGRHWYAHMDQALDTFAERGVLPDDELQRECVVHNAELTVLVDHFCGADVTADFNYLDTLRAANQP